MNLTIYQWIIVTGSSLILLLLSPLAKTPERFFKATKGKSSVSLWVLTSSLVISWIFAKSITNAANLGLKYGIVGGLAYSTYYLSFLIAGIVIFQMRTKGGFNSIHHFLSLKFGRSAVVLFSILIGFRLFNEVWSNTMVIGGYFGAQGSFSYYLSIIVFTILTLAYSLKGGLSSSLFTDAIQMILFFGLLLIILVNISPGFSENTLQGKWTLEGGLDLMFVALIQVFSYPFHDPVMTDRGFIAEPKKVLKAFLIAVPFGFMCIFLFSLVGVYARELGAIGDATIQVAKSLGLISMLLINFIMITSASSTLDSAFSSFSKLFVIDLKVLKVSVSNGRLVMIMMTILGTIPIFFNPEILSATTISGTMVIGLAPIFIFWKQNVPRITFLVVVLVGCCFGILLASGLFPLQWNYFTSDYGTLLSANIIGTVVCFLIYILLWFYKNTSIRWNK